MTITFSHSGRTTRVAAVRHDVVSLTLPWPPGDAVRARATWRGPDGLVVRRIGALL